MEALGDILTAATEQQRLLSVRRSSSGSSPAHRYEHWRQQLLAARGELEALIDFAEDQQFDESPASLTAAVARRVARLRDAIAVYGAGAARGELLREGFAVCLLGAPNAGKSSLLNLVVGREAAIVSQEAGTTRDVVEVRVDLGGYLCRFGDTAGLRTRGDDNIDGGGDDGRSRGCSEGDGPGPEGRGPAHKAIGRVEEEGIKRAKARALESDVVVLVVGMESELAASATPPPPSSSSSPAAAADSTPVERWRIPTVDQEVAAVAEQCHRKGASVVIAINKCDSLYAKEEHLLAVRTAVAKQLPWIHPNRVFTISCKKAAEHLNPSSVDVAQSYPNGAEAMRDRGGLQRFLQGLITAFQDMTSVFAVSSALQGSEAATAAAAAGTPDAAVLYDVSTWEEALGASERQRLLLQECKSHLDAFLAEVPAPSSPPPLSAPDTGTRLPLNATVRADDDVDDDNATAVDIVIEAECLRAAADCLARITGRGEAGDVEDVLGVVFEKCAVSFSLPPFLRF